MVLEYHMEYRGRDSWGWAARHGKEYQVTKGLGEVTQSTASDLPLVDVAMGHTRLATVGDVTVPNAHPWQVGNVIAAHNGGIWNSFELEARDGREYPVDSLALVERIAKYESDASDCEGYGSVHWLDTKKHSAFICRMRSGELDLAQVRIGEGSMLVWASDLSGAVEDLHSLGVRAVSLAEPKAGVVYRVDRGRIRRTKRRLRLQSGGSYYSRYCDWRDDDGYGYGDTVTGWEGDFELGDDGVWRYRKHNEPETSYVVDGPLLPKEVS